jgi:phospholipase C
MIEWRWGLAPLTVRDATAHNLARELDLAHPRLDAPTYAVPPVIGAVCPVNPGLVASRVNASGSSRAHWAALAQLAREGGWEM